MLSSPSSNITVVTIAGNRKGSGTDSADLRSWSALSKRLGHVTCIWAGASWAHETPSVQVVQRRRGSGLASAVWVVSAVRLGRVAVRDARDRGDDVVVNGGDMWGWLAAWLVARLTRSPFVMDVHGDLFTLPVASVGRRRKTLIKAAVSLFARLADERRVVSATTQDEMAKRRLSSTLVPPRLTPVWDERVEHLAPPLSQTSLRLLVVGRLVASKGYDLLLRALPQVRRQHPDVTLAIVGDGPVREELESQARDLGVAEVVDFLGSGDIEQIRAQMARADMFVISSRDEGLPRTLLEAVAAGLPVVSTSVGGIPAATHGWPTVRLVDVDVASIADGIRDLAADPPDAAILDAMRRRILDSYGFGPNLDLLADCYRRVIEH